MSLLGSDTDCLRERGVPHEISSEANMTCIVLPGWLLPRGYDHAQADLLVRLPAGYPDVAPDMWWFCPAVRLADGRAILATEVMEQHLGRTWQRWSRHFDAGQWNSGIDGLESYLALINRELERCAVGSAA
jgi:hypothetical protein